MANHIHIYFHPKRTRDQAPGSVPPSKFMPLVEALHQIIADRQQAKDADFDESKVKRSAGGQFSAQQHTAKAAEHEAAAASSQKGTPAHQAHTEAAQAHTLAAQHITTGTGWAQHHSAKAMQASQKASAAAGPANLDQLKAAASNPKASVEERAAAVQQLDKMEKAANTVAASPHAVPKMNVDPISHKTSTEGGVPHSNAPAPDAARKEANAKHFEGLAGAAAHPTTKQFYLNKAAEARGHAAPVDQGGLHPEMQSAASAAAKQPDAPARDPQSMMPAAEGALVPKPTTATSKGIKNQTHELLSSGHPFSLEELMKATGVQKPDMMRAYLADLKNPKYAAKAGALTIVKRPDGQYHVEKAANTPAAEATKRSFNFNQQGEQNLAPSIANKKDEGSGTRTAQDPHYGGSTSGEKKAMSTVGEKSSKSDAVNNAPPAPDHTELHGVLKGAAEKWPGSAMNPAHVEAAAKYMAGKRGVDLLKLSDATGLSIGEAQHLNEARLAHFKTQGGDAKLDRVKMASNYLKQPLIKTRPR